MVWDFIVDVIDEIHSSTLGVGFLRALGTLFLLWTMSALITAEIGYIRTGRFNLRVFIEVAMITLLRQLIIRPMQLAVGDNSMGWMDMAQFGLVLCGLLTIGIVHRLVGQAGRTHRSRTAGKEMCHPSAGKPVLSPTASAMGRSGKASCPRSRQFGRT